MSDARKPKMREAAEDAPLPKLDVESQPKRAPDRPLSPEQSYLQRKAEVAQQDHEKRSRAISSKKCNSPSRPRRRRPRSTAEAC